LSSALPGCLGLLLTCENNSTENMLYRNHAKRKGYTERTDRRLSVGLGVAWPDG
jgi:hypothetical protein